MPETLIPRHLQATIGNELEPRERIVWIGMPRARWLVAGSLFPVLFAIPWTAFAIFWVCGAAGFRMPTFTKPTDFFPLFGVPFVLVGLGMFLSPLWVYRKLKKTAYVITDRRAILFEGGRSCTIRSFPPEALTRIYRVERSNDRGDVIFEERNTDSKGETSRSQLGFMDVAEPKKVETLLRKLAETAGESATPPEA